jgi:hypothetical protein
VLELGFFVMSKLTQILILGLLLAHTSASIANETTPRIVHVVLVWLKEPGNEDHISQVIEATRSFSNIAGVEEVRVGQSVPSERRGVDDSFDVGLYMIFFSKAALEGYLIHPDHIAAQRAILRPLVRKVIVYDFLDSGS